jgi:hypothetical protein
MTRSATTISPIANRGSSPPAAPEKTTVRQPNRSARSVVTSAALTLPIPEPASTTSCPSIVPVTKTVCAASSLRESARIARRCASSCGMAQISPMVTPQCASPLAVEQRQANVIGDQRLGQPLTGARIGPSGAMSSPCAPTHAIAAPPRPRTGRLPRGAVRRAHPRIGQIPVDCEILATADGNQRLIILSAQPASESYGKLKLLGVLGHHEVGT